MILKDLQTALDKVKATLASKPDVDVFATVCFRNDRILTYDGCSGTIVGFKHGLDLCVEGEKFLKLVKNLSTNSPDEEIKLEHKKNKLHISCGNFKARLSTNPSEEFPDILPESPSKLCEATNLQEAFKEVSKDMLTKGDKELLGAGIKKSCVYSTTGLTISRAIIDSPADVSVHVPDTFVNQVKKIGNPDYLFRDKANVGAMFGDAKTILVTRQLSSSFPFKQLDVAISDEGCPYKLPDDLSVVLSRIVALEGPETEARFVWQPLGKKLNVHSPEIDDYVEWADGPVSDFSFSVNVKRFLSGLKRTPKINLNNVLYYDKRSITFTEDEWVYLVALAAE